MDVMRDIGMRIQRYRLSRYAAPEDRVRRRMRWAWLLAALWLAWAGFLSDHNFYRLWRLGQENAHARQELERLHGDVAELDGQMSDPAHRRQLGESVLREKNGMAKPGEIIYRIQGEPERPAP